MQELKITQGDEKAYNLTFTTGDAPLDITGATLTMTVKRRLSGTGPAFPPKVVTTHTAPTEGRTTLTLSPSDTGIELGLYYFDMQISGGLVKKKTFLRGTLEITWQTTED